MKTRQNIAAHGGELWQEINSQPAGARRFINADVNNAFYPPSAVALSAIQSHLAELNQLPDSRCRQLKKDLAYFHDIDDERIEVGSGSSELLQTVITGFIGQADNVVLLSPTYGEYERCARSAGGRIKKVKLRRTDGFAPNVDDILHQVDSSTRMLVICNPNNPTGRVLRRADLLSMLEALERRVWLVIDESYIDYCPDESMIGEVSKWPNLLVVRTFSKAFALAGLRIGYVALGENAHKRLSELIRVPWPVGLLSLKAAEAALNDDGYVRKMVSVTRRLTCKLVDELNRAGRIRAFPTQTNYFLLDVDGSGRKVADIVQALKEKMILVRDCSSFGEEFTRFIRITAQTEIDNQRIANALRVILR